MASAVPPITSNTMAEVQQILCPICHQPNLSRANFCQRCGRDVVLNNDGPMRFKITAIIKEGGQGAVYRAVAVDKNGLVQGSHVYAVKEMLDRSNNPKDHDEAIERFEHEAELLQRLRHPRIPRIYADFKDEGRQYLAMDFVEGQDLEEIAKQQGALPEQQVLEWADQICDVLAYLHNQRPEPIIFRDMKPSNVMIEPDGGIKLIDFGIAKVFQHAQRGTQIGTPGYAPPEQYQGLATPASDIYALGATLHHLLSGRDPRDEPPFSYPPVYGLNPKVSKRTSEAVQRALQMKPEDRYQSIAEFRAALRPLPPPTPQVRVASKTTVLPPAPQVAAPATTAARPATPQPSVAPAPQPLAAQPARRSRGGGFLRSLLVLVIVLGLAAGVTYFAFPDVVGQVVPGLLTAPTAVPQQTYVQSPEPFTVTDLEVIVPPGRDVLSAYTEAFVQLAQRDPKYGPGSIAVPAAPPGFIGTPEKLEETAQGTRYRATITGFIAVPKQ